MMRITRWLYGRFSTRLLLLSTLGSVLLAGCESVVEPSKKFLIRSPMRDYSDFPPPTFFVSVDDPEPILFEWEPAAGATSYAITFWRGEGEEEIMSLDVDLLVPLFSLEVTSPRIEEVRTNPFSETDKRVMRLVRHEVLGSEVAARLEAAGVNAGEPVYTLFSVFAEKGNDRWRSPSLHPVIFYLEVGS